MRNKGGRPTKWTKEKVLKIGEELIEWLREEDENVWFEKFLYVEKNLYPQWVSEMRDKYEEFSELIKKAKKIQESKIADMALQQNLSIPMAIFVLKNHYGWTDKTEQEIVVKQEPPLFSDDDIEEK